MCIKTEICEKKEKIENRGFGIVYKLQKDDKYYALKQILISNLTKEEINHMKKEVDILTSLENEYIVKYYCSFLEKDYFNLLMGYAGNTNLKQFINGYKNKGSFIEEEKIKNIIFQICLALKEIHKSNLTHRDLTPENIFIDENNKIKIGYFDVPKSLNQNNNYAKTITGKYQYFAPEILKGKKYNNKVDIYSFGCIIYELFTLNKYYQDKIIDNKEGKINTYIYNPKWQALIELLLKNNYHERPTAEEIYKFIISDNNCKVEYNNIKNGASNKTYKEYDRRGRLLFEGEYLNGKYNGKGKEYNFIDGKLEYEGEFLNGKWNGKGKKYYKGKLEYEGEYINNIRNGKGKEYDYKGILRFEGEYLNGIKWSGKGYNEKGIEYYEIINGKGIYKDYNFFTGKIIYEGEYLNGKKNGKGKVYNDDGELIFEGELKDGIKWNGKGKIYNYGHLIYFGEIVKGKKNGKAKEYDDGKLIFEGEFLNGEREGNGKEFYGNGKIKIEGKYLKGKINGKVKEYDKWKGELIFEGEYLNGEKWNGKSIEYYDDGKLKFEGGN